MKNNFIQMAGHAVAYTIGAIFNFINSVQLYFPGQTSKRNAKSISSAISSQQISGKNSESK